MGEPDRAIASGQRALALAEASGDFACSQATNYLGHGLLCPWATIVGRWTVFGQTVASLEGDLRP